MKTKIYSVFPACGKTWMCKHQEGLKMKILDADSSQFNWLYIRNKAHELSATGNNNPTERCARVRNPEFPDNYIRHIKENIGEYDCIFVSSHASVRDALDAAGLDFTIVYPSEDQMTEWIGRCFVREKRGESGCGPDAMYQNWQLWIDECKRTGDTHREIVLRHGQYLSDRIRTR